MKLFTFIIFSICLVPACDGGKSTRNIDLDIDSSPFTFDELVGTWSNPCGVAYFGDFVSIKITYTTTSLTAESRGYSDSDCTEPDNTLTYTQKYSVKGNVASPENAQKIDFENISMVQTAESEVFLRSLNVAKLCDIDDWEIGEGRSIRDATCGDLDHSKTLYDIFYISGTKLRFGLAGGSSEATGRSSDENRPTELSPLTLTKE